MDNASETGENFSPKDRYDVVDLISNSFSQGRREDVQESVNAFGDLDFPSVPRIVHVGLDSLDTFEFGTGSKITRTGSDAEQIQRYLIPIVVRETIRKEADNKNPGLYLFRYLAGNDQKTHHPHDFYFNKKDNGTIELYFVDPEKSVAERSGRPNVTNLVGLQIAPDRADDRFFVSRFFCSAVPHADLKMRLQLQVAQAMLTDADYPKLTVDPRAYHQAVLINSRRDRTELRSRFTPAGAMSLLSQGKCVSPEIAKQINAAYRVLGQCMMRLNDARLL